jgi:quercetin dioxygenase-like cupin family protein
MFPARTKPSRFTLACTLVASGAVGLLLISLLAGPTATQQSVFTGGNPTTLDPEGIRMLRLEFPAGSRANWHTHTDGQLLMIEQGRGRTQERGRPVREMHPGDSWYTPAGVEHWHGAAPDERAIQWTIYGGEVVWLEPVTDDVYRAPLRR